VTTGRVKGGQLSKTALYKSAPVKVHKDTQYGFDFDYSAPMVIERGDSGGASFAAGTHSIVSVNSTGDSNTMLIARTDLVAGWIAKQLASHDGSQPSGGGQGGSDPGTGGSDQGGEGGSDQGGEGGSDQGGGNPGGGTQPGWLPPGQHPQPGQPCVFVPWAWRFYCWE
jgi:hypothetical protein